MSAGRCRVTGSLTVALPPDEAFALFTPRGEERWAPGWRPRFPAPAADDAAPGTVFETIVHGEATTWVVLDRRRGRHISYARVTPGSRAGTVTVDIEEAGPRDADPGEAGGEGPSGGRGRAGSSVVRVTYDLTALTPAAEAGLAEFAAGYPGYLRSWEESIASL